MKRKDKARKMKPCLFCIENKLEFSKTADCEPQKNFL